MFYKYFYQDFNIEFNGEIAKLIINDAYIEDSGEYSCEAANEIGKDSAKFKVTIKGFILFYGICV